MKYGIYIKPEVPVYLGTYTTEENNEGVTVSSMADEGLYGTVCRILEENNDWAHILSSYGYAGYVKREDMLVTDKEGALQWLSDLMITKAITTDVLSAPTVHGCCRISLPRGSLVKAVRENGVLVQTEGWTLVELADGSRGYVPTIYLMEKRFNEELLKADPEDLMDRQENAIKLRTQEIGGMEGFCLKTILDKYFNGSEEAFRKELTDMAKSYLGVQYRWAGRSSHGIDCSGLVGMCYLMCGITIYRDASIVRDYPLKKLEVSWENGKLKLDSLESLLPGDALYFPGHIAMYLGDGMYIHSTAKAGSNGVVYNSLIPGHKLFRQDLLDSLYAVAGVRL